MAFTPLGTPSGYDPGTLELLCRVFNELVAEMGSSEDRSTEARRMTLAMALMDGVVAGQRDPDALKRHALAKLAGTA
jgi:hypothetical protein